MLQDEEGIYKQMQGCTGFPDVYWYGYHDDFSILAFELLGPSLEDLFAFCHHKFSLATVLMLVDQLLPRLQDLHSRNIIHRDVKPSNCLLGAGVNGNTVYVTDFGLADYTCVDEDSEDHEPSYPQLIGTSTFASVRAHQGRGTGELKASACRFH
jgi:serine/threonine protein kinase